MKVKFKFGIGFNVHDIDDPVMKEEAEPIYLGRQIS
jgi:hypothetical protein